MDHPFAAFDWNQARAFLVTAEAGSFSAAARRLGQAQPTLGRQVAALEEALGATLFERLGRRLEPTETGLALLEHIREMGEAATRASLTASGAAQSIRGLVRITASDLLSSLALPPILAELRRIAPEIEVELVVANDLRDLARREADIALRNLRPEQPDLVARKVGEGRGRLYASRAWLEREGRPETPADLARADFIFVRQRERMLEVLVRAGLPLGPGNVRVTADSGPVLVEMTRAGLGIGVLPESAARRHPELECVLPELPPLVYPVWLVAHRELRTSLRIRTVFDLLARRLPESPL